MPITAESFTQLNVVLSNRLIASIIKVCKYTICVGICTQTTHTHTHTHTYTHMFTNFNIRCDVGTGDGK